MRLSRLRAGAAGSFFFAMAKPSLAWCNPFVSAKTVTPPLADLPQAERNTFWKARGDDNRQCERNLFLVEDKAFALLIASKDTWIIVYSSQCARLLNYALRR